MLYCKAITTETNLTVDFGGGIKTEKTSRRHLLQEPVW